MRPPCARQCRTRCSNFEMFKNVVFHRTELRGAGRADETPARGEPRVGACANAGEQKKTTNTDMEPLARWMNAPGVRGGPEAVYAPPRQPWSAPWWWRCGRPPPVRAIRSRAF